MTRFFVEPEELLPDFLVLTGENAQHAKVLRLKCGEEVLVCDGQGRECLCAVSDVSDGRISLVVRHRQESESEAAVHVSVYMAFPKGDKLEHVIQKATELGAYEIVAFPSARCVSRPDEKSLKKKLERWQKIAASAAEQSGRGRVPQVLVLPSYKTALERAAKADKARKQGIERTLFPELTADEQRIVDALKQHGDSQTNVLVMHTGLPISTIVSQLFSLEMKGVVTSLPGNAFHLIS